MSVTPESPQALLSLQDDDFNVFIVVLAPFACMLVGSAAVSIVTVPPRLQACMQNFSAGLLISAVAGELYPLMSNPELENAGVKVRPPSAVESYLSLCVGFAVGLLFMFGLEQFTEGADDSGKEPETDDVKSKEDHGATLLEEPMLLGTQEPRFSGTQEAATMTALPSHTVALQEGVQRLDLALSTGSRDNIDEVLHGIEASAHKVRRLLLKREDLDPGEVSRIREHWAELQQDCLRLQESPSSDTALKALRAFELTLRHMHKHTERSKNRRWKVVPSPSSASLLPHDRVPWPMVLAIAVDAAVDGLLIGLASSASQSAGWSMSIATSIEMGFLGLSFSATIRDSTRSAIKQLALVSLPPVVLLLSGIAGQGIGHALVSNPALFVGFIAFAIVALLFLVTQELLTAAHEVAGDSVFANVLLFVGLLAGILLEKVLGGSEKSLSSCATRSEMNMSALKTWSLV